MRARLSLPLIDSVRKPGVTGFRLARHPGAPFEVGVLISCDSRTQLHVHIAAGKTTFTTKMQ